MLSRSKRSERNDSRRNTSPGSWTISLACLAMAGFALGCAPEVGSEAWCTDMKEKPKADWSGNEAVDFAKHCLLK